MNLLLQSVLEAHPLSHDTNVEVIGDAVEALSICQQVCLVCADACLAETQPEKIRVCVRLSRECATVCSATLLLLLGHDGTQSSVVHAQLHACVLACQACSDACADRGIHHEYCALCAEACRRCQERCNVALGEFSPAGFASNA
jgi:hypothetical protein